MFWAAKKKWSALLSARSGIGGNRCYLSKSDFVDELGLVWRDCLSVTNVQSGFSSTGIFPVDSRKYPIERLSARLL